MTSFPSFFFPLLMFMLLFCDLNLCVPESRCEVVRWFVVIFSNEHFGSPSVARPQYHEKTT